ncbi:hypothetical protein IE81DRAFT_339786 [Ceraceosorus guamensis]|uniref:GATA-type domain-containing protein n=1 Tax=Ceraceosorus guamensis TaxID=1522189 RepID=A0A316WB95_9BASI|nr:hypothetical protein IE81DRAFT_339786 [Ceraceosorus guamensis]PWN44885.1 hypothetical protein IE81DRAFT_339786 [Ceraceosorus guamensis]
MLVRGPHGVKSDPRDRPSTFDEASARRVLDAHSHAEALASRTEEDVSMADVSDRPLRDRFATAPQIPLRRYDLGARTADRLEEIIEHANRLIHAAQHSLDASSEPTKAQAHAMSNHSTRIHDLIRSLHVGQQLYDDRGAQHVALHHQERAERDGEPETASARDGRAGQKPLADSRTASQRRTVNIPAPTTSGTFGMHDRHGPRLVSIDHDDHIGAQKRQGAGAPVISSAPKSALPPPGRALATPRSPPPFRPPQGSIWDSRPRKSDGQVNEPPVPPANGKGDAKAEEWLAAQRAGHPQEPAMSRRQSPFADRWLDARVLPEMAGSRLVHPHEEPRLVNAHARGVPDGHQRSHTSYDDYPPRAVVHGAHPAYGLHGRGDDARPALPHEAHSGASSFAPDHYNDHYGRHAEYLDAGAHRHPSAAGYPSHKPEEIGPESALQRMPAQGQEPSAKYRKRSRAAAPALCGCCFIVDTPEWRRGPDGPRTVCNACGLHYAKLAKKRQQEAPDGPGITIQELRASIRVPSMEVISHHGSESGGDDHHLRMLEADKSKGQYIQAPPQMHQMKEEAPNYSAHHDVEHFGGPAPKRRALSPPQNGMIKPRSPQPARWTAEDEARRPHSAYSNGSSTSLDSRSHASGLSRDSARRPLPVAQSPVRRAA